MKNLYILLILIFTFSNILQANSIVEKNIQYSTDTTITILRLGGWFGKIPYNNLKGWTYFKINNDSKILNCIPAVKASDINIYDSIVYIPNWETSCTITYVTSNNYKKHDKYFILNTKFEIGIRKIISYGNDVEQGDTTSYSKYFKWKYNGEEKFNSTFYFYVNAKWQTYTLETVNEPEIAYYLISDINNDGLEDIIFLSINSTYDTYYLFMSDKKGNLKLRGKTDLNWD
jgi:hypothetical protein